MPKKTIRAVLTRKQHDIALADMCLRLHGDNYKGTADDITVLTVHEKGEVKQCRVELTYDTDNDENTVI